MRHCPANCECRLRSKTWRKPSPNISNFSTSKWLLWPAIALGLLMATQLGQCTPLDAAANSADGSASLMDAFWNGGGNAVADNVVQELRGKRSSRRLSSASAENGYPWRKRYYVSRWHRLNRFSPSGNSRESNTVEKAPERLCGIKLTNRTRELCGECAPGNMQRVVLMEKKKADRTIVTRDRLTEMCCTKRCTDQQIRDYCCRSQ